MRTAIVLAGGRASRFGRDKLAAELDGRSILMSTIYAVDAIADAVIVAGASLATGRIGDRSIAVVDDREPFGGPLLGLAGALASARAHADDLAIVVGGDMPRLVPAVLAAMLAALEQAPAVDALLLAPAAARGEGSQRRQVLPLAIRVVPAARAAREAIEDGERSLRALVDRLTVVEFEAGTWLALDPDAQTLLDVDTPEDLERLGAGRPSHELRS